MCFSAGVSFGASAVILVISVASFKKASTPAQAVLAGIPLFFGIQQAIEGVLWLSLRHEEYHYLYSFATHSFLVLALVVWPTMIPLMAMLPEQDERRKKILKFLLGAGVLVSLFHLYCLIHFGASASAKPNHIRYEFHFPESMLYISSIIYFVPALIPAFISGIKALRWLGLALVCSYAFSWIFYHHYIISVWCFFATIISGIALIAIVQMQAKEKARLAILPPPRD
jgi:hypothetical protein